MDGAMFRQLAAVEHHRLHCAEDWPDGPHKQAVIAAIHARATDSLCNARVPENTQAYKVCHPARVTGIVREPCVQRNDRRGRVHQSSHQTRISCKGRRPHLSAGAIEAAPASIGLVTM
jgi:hypothetical protein